MGHTEVELGVKKIITEIYHRERERERERERVACRNRGSFETTAAVKCACILSRASNTIGSFSFL